MSAPLRPRLFAALLCLVVAWQVVGALDVLGLRYPGVSVWVVVVLGNAVPPLLGLIWPAIWRRAPIPSPEEVRLPRLVWLGFVAWAAWAGGYYVIAERVIASAQPLSPAWTTRWESNLPIVPAAVLVYMGVHPLSALPFFGLRSFETLRRHAIGHFVILGVSAAAWLALPLTLPRAPLPAPEGSLGLWVLTSLRGNDPPVNLLPSTHCSMAIYAALALRTIDPRLGAWAALTAIGIAIATLLTRQHYLLDVVTGVTLGLVVGGAVWRRSAT